MSSLYTKEDEVNEVRGIISSYERGMQYEYIENIDKIKEIAKNSAFDINSGDARNMGNLFDTAGDIADEYRHAKSVREELDKVNNVFNQAIPVGDLQGDVANKIEMTGKKMFSDVRRSADYQKIMGKIALNFWHQERAEGHSRILAGLGIDDDSYCRKMEELESHAKEWKISKNNLIYYNHVLGALCQQPEYIAAYQQEQQKAQAQQTDQGRTM